MELLSGAKFSNRD